MTRKIAIGVVTYNSNKTLLNRLKVVSSQRFSLYVFDNSPEISIVRDFCKKLGNAKYITCGKNVGLGFGISSVCAQAYYDNHRALVFFDQDTIFNKTTLTFIEDFYSTNSHLSEFYSSIVFNSKNISDTDSINRNNKFIFKDVLMAINSGSLYFLENLKKINWFNETYFVDCVDYEFCLNSSNNKLKIGECSITPGFDHESDQGDIKKIIFGKQRKLRNYSSQRVFSTSYASIRLFWNSLINSNFKFSVAIMRSLAGYLFWQLIVRIIIIFKLDKRMIK